MFHVHSLRLGLILTTLALLLTFPAIVNASPPADGYLPGCTGEYFNNVGLSGSPALVRTDAAINFFWPEGTSPGPGVNTNNYSVRWTCSAYVAAPGNYTFNIVTDDGMNLLVDGTLVIWAWYDQGPTSYSTIVSMAAGWHTIRVEYYNRTLGGTAKVFSTIVSTPPPPTITDWQGEYFNNPSLSGTPAIVRNDANINFDWGAGAPDPAIPADYFSVRWTRTLNLSTGTWRFITTTDDGVRLWVDGSLAIDKWILQSATAYWVDIPLSAGNHTVKMEYFENSGNAVAKLTYAPVSPPPPTGAWHGQYFNNIALSGAPALVRDDAAINFNWGEGSPAPVVAADNFSIKWDSVQTLPTTGNYSITATSDDGVRVWIDGFPVIDAWYDHPPMTFTATRYLVAGAHAIHVEYYERGGGAMVSVQIVPGTPPPPPSGDVIVDDRGPGWQAGGIGTWRNSAAGIGGHSFWTLNNTYTAYGYNWARWYPTLPAPGYYEVFAYIPDSLGTTLNARYWVYHNSRYDVAPRAQGFYPERWLSLGTYYFSAGGGEYVSLSDVTYECYLCRSVAFDAIKFSPR